MSTPPLLDGDDGYISYATGGCAAVTTAPQITINGQYTDLLINNITTFSGDGMFQHVWGNFTGSQDTSNLDQLFCQFNDNTQLQLWRFRTPSGDDNTCYLQGSYYFGDDDGVQHLASGDFLAVPQSLFYQPQGKTTRYPMKWVVTVPSLDIQITLVARRSDDPVLTSWDGLFDIVAGTRSGTCFVTMTGQRGNFLSIYGIYLFRK